MIGTPDQRAEVAAELRNVEVVPTDDRIDAVLALSAAEPTVDR